MANPRRTFTNAADSAPGVGDGHTSAPPPKVDSMPSGRGWVLLAVAIFLVILALIFISGPRRGQADVPREPATASTAASSSERPTAP